MDIEDINKSLQRLPAPPSVGTGAGRQGRFIAPADLTHQVKKMKNDSQIIPSGPFKGKKLEFAPTTGIEKFRAISENFMNKIFGLEPGEYLISDESSLHDFTGLDDVELPDIHKKIQEVYTIDVSDIKSKNLLEIFKRISHSKREAAR